MEKINIAELLKDCQKGLELDCTLYDNIVLDSISNWTYPIRVTTKDGSRSLNLTKYGCTSENQNAKCVIFPKGKTTWEEFVPPRQFKDGDILISGLEDCGDPFIFKRTNGFGNAQCYCAINVFGGLILNSYNWTPIKGCRLATEEEKQKLFDAIKDNGYHWNAKTKTLEKLITPKFKVGDKVKYKGDKTNITITGIKDDYYFIQFFDIRKNDYQNEKVLFKDLDKYELVLNKFDITTLKPFESRVLVRSSIDGLWKPTEFGFRNGYNDNAFYIVGGSCWKQCIPYLNNEHLCGTTNDCDEYYKTWEQGTS